LWLMIAVVCLVVEIRIKCNCYDSDYALEGGETYTRHEQHLFKPMH